MKTKLSFLILLLMLISCNGKDEMDLIKVESDAIHIWPGATRTLSILSEGTFYVTSLDATVAQARVENNTVVVTATGIGKTSLLLNDGKHDELQIRVFTMLIGLYTEEHEFEEYVPKISVTADSKEIADDILRELTTEMSKFNNAHYGFEAGGRFFLGLQNELNNPYRGTFVWDGNTLVLNYADKTETYSFQGVNNGPRSYGFSATLNLTDKYIKLYPDAGIENVSVTRFITAVPPFM